MKGLGTLQVTNIQEETNYNILSENIDIYTQDYSFPIKTGDKFPNDKLKDRANKSYTNRLLFKNDYEKIFDQYLNSFSALNNMWGMQLRDITAQLPFFNKVVSGFIGLCVGNGVLFDFPDINNDTCDLVINNSNIKQAIRSIFEGDFLDACNLYVVHTDNFNKPVIQQIPTKNFIVYNDPNNIHSVYSYLTFSIVNNKIEFIEYIYNGVINKKVFGYESGTIGKIISEESTVAFNGKYNEAPVVLFKNNVEHLNDTYGQDRFSRFDSAVLAVCRTFADILRLSDKCKEIIKKVPESSIERNSGIGGIFLNRGVISYNDNLSSDLRPDIDYTIPELRNNIEACIEVYKQAVKTLSMSSGLSHIFFDFEKVGTGVLSGRALESMMLPTMIEVNRLCEDKEPDLKLLIRKMLLTQDININTNKIDIDFNQGIPKDEKEQTDIVTERLNNKTLSLVDAIRKLDRVPLRIAKEQARNILCLLSENSDTGIDEVDTNIENNKINDINFETVNDNDMQDNKNVGGGNTIPDCAMPIAPTDYTM